MEKSLYEDMNAALEKARTERDHASYLSECGQNAGIRKMNSNKAEWLKWVVYLAERGLEAEKLLSEPEDIQENEPVCDDCLGKDKFIADLTIINKQLKEQLKSLEDAYSCEVEYRKELTTRAKIDWCNEMIKQAHERCWLDGTVLVTPIEYLDHCLLKLVKE